MHLLLYWRGLHRLIFVLGNFKGVFDYLVAEVLLLEKFGLFDEGAGARERVGDVKAVEQGPRDARLTAREMASSYRYQPS